MLKIKRIYIYIYIYKTKFFHMLYNIEWCVALRTGTAGWCIAIIYNNVIHVHGFGNSVDGTNGLQKA